jgi:hypothetical protein
MKTALKIGFSTTTQHWKSTLMQSKSLIFTFILFALFESFLLNEVIHLIGWTEINYGYSKSIFSVDLLDFFDNDDSLASYLSSLSRSFFYEFLILNSFFLGVYYHHTGFPKQGETNSARLDNVLDVPMEENGRATLSLVLQYVTKETRVYYFKIILLFIIAQFLGGIIGNYLYRIFTFAGQVYYLVFGQLIYFLLLLLYLKWLDLPFYKISENKYKWMLLVVGGLLLPNAGWYIWSALYSVVKIVTNLLSGFGDIKLLLQFLTGIAYYMLLVPFISIFYSQTLIYFKHEQEA